jgi:uncharacterized membrane protein
MSSAEAPIFKALIVPYRSLNLKGALIVVGALVVMTAAVAFRFWLLGAWPVLVFSAVETPLLVVLLTINMRGARANELIMVDATQVTVLRTDPAGRRRQEALPVAWLRVDLNATNGTSSVVLRGQGRICEVGAFLHEPDKASLFKSLEIALHRVNNPRFDNPQLRE